MTTRSHNEPESSPRRATSALPAEAIALLHLADGYERLASGDLAARLGLPAGPLKPWLTDLSLAYLELAAEAGAITLIRQPDVRRVRQELPGLHRGLAEQLAGTKNRVTTVLDARQLEVVLTALDEAARQREARSTSTCPVCTESWCKCQPDDAQLCAEHLADLDQADIYRSLIGQLDPLREIDQSIAVAIAQETVIPFVGAVRQVACERCGRDADRRCTRDGDHFARWLTAFREGLISREAFTDLFTSLEVATPGLIIAEPAA